MMILLCSYSSCLFSEEEKEKRIHELNIGFSYRFRLRFGLPAEPGIGGGPDRVFASRFTLKRSLILKKIPVWRAHATCSWGSCRATRTLSASEPDLAYPHKGRERGILVSGARAHTAGVYRGLYRDPVPGIRNLLPPRPAGPRLSTYPTPHSGGGCGSLF